MVTSTVMFIPSTRGGKLTAMMKENVEKMASMTKFKVKYQEAGGMKLAMLFNTNLAKGEHCQRQECQSCNSRSEDRPNCKTQSILYESKCRECNPVPSHEERENKAPRIGIYVGETSRSLFERSLEHHRDAEAFSRVAIWSNIGYKNRKRPGHPVTSSR